MNNCNLGVGTANHQDIWNFPTLNIIFLMTFNDSWRPYCTNWWNVLLCFMRCLPDIIKRSACYLYNIIWEVYCYSLEYYTRRRINWIYSHSLQNPKHNLKQILGKKIDDDTKTFWRVFLNRLFWRRHYQFCHLAFQLND